MKGKQDCPECQGVGFISYVKAGVSFSQPCTCTIDEPPGGLPDNAKRLKHLLAQIGEPGHCRGCGHKILWVIHRNGKRTPYTEQGLNHFIDCPARDLFRRQKKTQR